MVVVILLVLLLWLVAVVGVGVVVTVNDDAPQEQRPSERTCQRTGPTTTELQTLQPGRSPKNLRTLGSYNHGKILMQRITMVSKTSAWCRARMCRLADSAGKGATAMPNVNITSTMRSLRASSWTKCKRLTAKRHDWMAADITPNAVGKSNPAICKILTRRSIKPSILKLNLSVLQNSKSEWATRRQTSASAICVDQSSHTPSRMSAQAITAAGAPITSGAANASAGAEEPKAAWTTKGPDFCKYLTRRICWAGGCESSSRGKAEATEDGR